MAESLMNWNEIQTSVFFMIGAVVVSGGLVSSCNLLL